MSSPVKLTTTPLPPTNPAPASPVPAARHAAGEASSFHTHLREASARKQAKPQNTSSPGKETKPSAGASAQPQGHWIGICGRPLVRRSMPSVRQPKAGCSLRRPCAHPLAERSDRPRPRGVEVWQSQNAGDTDPGGLALGTPPARLGSYPMVQGAGHAEWRAAEEIDDHRARTQAARSALEVRQRRGRHRGRCGDGGLTTESDHHM